MKGGVQMSQKSSVLAVEQLLGVARRAAPREGARARRSRFEGDRSATATISTSSRRAGVARPLRGVAAQGDVAGAEERAAQPHRQPPSRPSEREDLVEDAERRLGRGAGRWRAAGFTRKCGLYTMLIEPALAGTPGRAARRPSLSRGSLRRAVLHELDADQQALAPDVADELVTLLHLAEPAEHPRRRASAAFSTSPSSSITVTDARTAAPAIGLPP